MHRAKVIPRVVRGLTAAAAAALASPAHAEWALNLTKGVTPLSREIYDLHSLILWICVVIGVIVYGAMFIAIVRHRKSVGHKAAQFHHSTFAEILWTAIPVLILVGMAYPATRTLINIEDSSDPDVTIKTTGYQWKWRYEYVDEGVSFFSSLAPSSRKAIYEDPKAVEHYLLDVDNRVVVPVGKKVRVLLTSDDVIHAWWVPAFGMKRDAIPGFVNELWFRAEKEGVYRGQCAELCGAEHGFMPIVVEARSEEGYRQWIAERQQAQAAERQAAAPPPTVSPAALAATDSERSARAAAARNL